MFNGPMYDKKHTLLVDAVVPAFASKEALKDRLAELFTEGSIRYPERLIQHMLDLEAELPLAGRRWKLGAIRTKDQWSRTRQTAVIQEFGPVQALVAAVILAENSVLTAGMGTPMRFHDEGKGSIFHFDMKEIQRGYSVRLAITIDNDGRLGLEEYTWGGSLMDCWSVVSADDDQFIIKC